MAVFIRLSVLLALMSITACDWGRMWETPAVRPHEEKLFVMDKDVVPFPDGEARYRATPENELASMLEENQENVIKGEKLYFVYCVQCHGENHDGNGTVGQSFYPLPTDLRSKKVQDLSEGTLFKHISYGTPEGRQPPLATTVSVKDRWFVILYVKSIGVR